MKEANRKDIQTQIQTNQLALVNDNVLNGLVSSFVLGVIALYVSYSEDFEWLFLVKLVCLIGLLLFRAILLIKLKSPTTTSSHHSFITWHFVSVIFSSLFYAILAVSTYWFTNYEKVIIVYLIISGVSAGAVSAYSSLKGLAASFTLPVLISLFVVSVIKGGEMNYIIAFTTGLFAFFMINIYKGIYEKLYHSFKKGIIIKDLTEQKLKLQEQEEIKRDFFASMSHEIRTPLNGVFGLIDMLNTTELTKTQKDYLDTIKMSSHDLLRVVNDVVDLSKIESGNFRIDARPFQPEKLFKESIKLYSKKALEKRVDLVLNIKEELPEYLKGDSTRIRQVLNNLLSNAIKFTNEGSDVLIDIGYENDILKWSVSDQGEGIEEDKLEHIFQRYKQIQKKEKFENVTDQGTGLGLSICKELVALMGGEITVENKRQEKGAVFTVKLPLMKVEVNNGLEQIANFKRLKFDKTVLIVDDRDINLKVTSLLLNSLGVNVLQAKNGLEALELVKGNSESIHLILMDIQMPVMNGIESTEAIKDYLRGKYCPAIFALSAQLESNLDKQAASYGFDGYLTKPINKESLICVLSDL